MEAVESTDRQGVNSEGFMFDSVGRGCRQKGPSHAGDKSKCRQAIFHFCAECATHYPVESAVCEGGTDYPHLQRRKLRFRSKSFSQKVAQLKNDPVWFSA